MERFEFNPGTGLYVPVKATVHVDMHRNEMVHIAAAESPDGRERWIGANNPCIREPRQPDPKLCIRHAYPGDMKAISGSLGQGDRQFRGIR